MNQKTFLFEKNGWTVSKLTVLMQSYFIVENKTTGRRYIRKSMPVVEKIISS